MNKINTILLAIILLIFSCSEESADDNVDDLDLGIELL